MAGERFKLAIIAGEPSGDLLGANLVSALKAELESGGKKLELIGVGGDALQAEGLSSKFDYSELSIMGFTAVLKDLPRLLWRIRQTRKFIAHEKPDALLIIDSPDFTHRVAKRVRESCPDIPIINYVCPTVWAWKPERASKMRAYIDHVLAIFPFEPEVVSELGGPPLTYIGHRLSKDDDLAAIRAAQKQKKLEAHKTILLLPGSRSSEVNNLLEPMRLTAQILAERHNNNIEFIVPTLPRFQTRIEAASKDWELNIKVVSDTSERNQAFAKADASLAASGTVLLELAMAKIPTISIYKPDLILRLLSSKITTWSAALPNLIVGYPYILEYFDRAIRPEALARSLERLASDTPERAAQIQASDKLIELMCVDQSPGKIGAKTLLDVIKKCAPNNSN